MVITEHAYFLCIGHCWRSSLVSLERVCSVVRVHDDRPSRRSLSGLPRLTRCSGRDLERFVARAILRLQTLQEIPFVKLIFAAATLQCLFDHIWKINTSSVWIITFCEKKLNPFPITKWLKQTSPKIRLNQFWQKWSTLMTSISNCCPISSGRLRDHDMQWTTCDNLVLSIVRVQAES